MTELEIEQLKEEIIRLKNELEKTKEHLKKYTAPASKKQYYEKNKEEKIKEYKKDYKYTPSKEQKQRWARTAYLNRKAKQPLCISCNLMNVNNKNNLCGYCDPNSKKKIATKEMKVVKFIQDNSIEFIHNKSVGYTCGNYRPDILIDCNTHFIVVEIDENQHESYNQNCEMARMNNIYVALGLPTIFLRYNPDKVFHNNNLKKLVLIKD